MSENKKSYLTQLLESKLSPQVKPHAKVSVPEILETITTLLATASHEVDVSEEVCSLIQSLPEVIGLAVFTVPAQALHTDQPKRLISLNGDSIPAPASKRTLSGTLHAVNRADLEKVSTTRYFGIPSLRKADGWLAVQIEKELGSTSELCLLGAALALGISISRSNINKTIEDINQRVSVFQELTRLSASNATKDRIFEVLAKDAGFRIHANATLVLEYDSQSDTFIPKGAYGIPKTKLPPSVRSNDSQLTRALSLNTLISIPDIANLKDEDLTFLSDLGFKAAHIAPLSLQQDEFGVLILLYKKQVTLSPEKTQLLNDQTQGGAIALAGAHAREIMKTYTSELERLVEDRTSDLVVQTARADEANLAKSQFVANMSHELRTPLTAIVGYSSVLNEGLFGELNEEQKDALGAVIKATEHLKDLINDVLDMARIESGKEEGRPTEVKMSEYIPQICKLMAQTAQGKRLELISPRSEELENLSAFVDSRHARQILINIVSNAVKYTQPQGTIEIKVRNIADKIAISVADTGVGISAAQQHLVFQEYSRLEEEYSQSQVGTGLGLNLTKRLVELNGGTIGFDSEVGIGSTFTFTMPMFSDAAQESPEEVSIKALAIENISTNCERVDGLSILILDDDQASSLLLQTILQRLGAEIHLSGSIQEAQEIINATHIDIALIDLALRGESGHTLIEHLGKQNNNIPSIVVSACVFDKDMETAKLAGASSFVKKPYDPQDLIHEIRSKTIERVLVGA